MRLEDPLNIQSTFISFAGVGAPAVAPAGEARLWFDQANSQVKFSLNGGAYSAGLPIATAPPASGTQASLLLDSGSGGTAFNGNAAGTVLGINLGTGTSDLIRAQKAGQDRFSVSETGIMTTVSAIIGGFTLAGTATITATDANTIGLVVRPAVASPAANTFAIQNNTGSQTYVTFGGSSPFFNVLNNAFGFFYNGQISTSHRMGASSDTATAIPLATKALGSQTANVFQALDSGNVARVFIGSLVQVADPTLALRAITSQTGKLLEFRDAATGAALSGFNTNGDYVNSTGGAAISPSTGNQQASAGNGLIVQPKTAALPALIVKTAAAHTASAQEWQDNGNVARVKVSSLTAVADSTLTLRAITSQTGRLLLGRNAGDTADLFKFLVDGRGVFAAPNSAVADADLQASSLSFYLNEAGNTVVVKAKYADGTTIKTGTIAIA